MDNTFSVILPIHSLDNGLEKLFENAVASVPVDIELIVVTAPDIKDVIEKKAVIGRGKVTTKVITNEDTTLAAMVNRGVKEVATEYFSILEADDTFTGIWFETARRYVDEKPEIFCFLPLNHIVDEDGKVTGFGNEAPLALNFSANLGYIDYESLQEYMAYSLTGAIFNKDDWEAIGGLKTNIKYSFWFEFMLRATKAEYKFLVVPRVGYRHLLGRPGSMFALSKDTFSREEMDYWYNVALDEHIYHEQREVAPYKAEA